MIFFILKLFD